MLLLAAGCAPRGKVEPPEPGKDALEPGTLLRLQDGEMRPLSQAAFLDQAAGVDYVLLGEGHTVACDHKVQAHLLDLLGQGQGHWTVGLEMLGADQQFRLDAVNRKAEQLLDDPQALQRELAWERNWGFGFDLYAPVLQAAMRQGMPLYALNVPKGVLRELRRKGRENLSPEQRKWLPEDIIPPLEEQRESLRQVFAAHQEFMGGKGKDPEVLDKRLERFILVQSIWDTAMARRARELHRELDRSVAVIAGSGHVENGWGIAHRLRVLEPGARVLLVMPWRGGEPPSKGLGDVYYFCPESVTTRQGLTLSWMPSEEGGFIFVEEVSPDSLAGKADLRAGDEILEADGRRLGSLGGLHLAAVTASREGRSLRLVIRRNGYRLNMTLPVAKKGE